MYSFDHVRSKCVENTLREERFLTQSLVSFSCHIPEAFCVEGLQHVNIGYDFFIALLLGHWVFRVVCHFSLCLVLFTCSISRVDIQIYHPVFSPKNHHKKLNFRPLYVGFRR